MQRSHALKLTSHSLAAKCAATRSHPQPYLLLGYQTRCSGHLLVPFWPPPHIWAQGLTQFLVDLSPQVCHIFTTNFTRVKSGVAISSIHAPNQRAVRALVQSCGCSKWDLDTIRALGNAFSSLCGHGEITWCFSFILTYSSYLNQSGQALYQLLCCHTSSRH